MDLDSALLRAFVALADDLHFGRAAEGLHISQQGLSKRVARMEKLLGAALFVRDRHGVSLTDVGRRLLPEARRAVDAVDAVSAALDTSTHALIVDVLDEHLAMLPRVRSLAVARPDLGLSAVMRHGRDAMEMLRAGETHVALGRPGHITQPWPSDTRGRAVLAEPIQVLVPTGHPLHQDGVTMAQLAQQPLWFPTAGAPREWTDLLDELVATFDLSVDQSGASFGFDHWLGQVGVGSALPTLVGAAMELPAGLPLARVPITNPTPVFWWWAMWRGRRLAARIEDLVGLLECEPPIAGAWLPARDRVHSAPVEIGGRRVTD